MAKPAAGRLNRRLNRILLLLPYAIQNPGVSIDELAERFDVGRKDLLEDLQLVFFCGLPGYGPGDLIDVTLDDDRVYVDMADYFGSPLRLTPAEALALYAGGAAMVALPGMGGAGALKRALKKLRGALGPSADETGVEVSLAAGPAEHMSALQEALTRRRRVRLEYFSSTQGRLTDREVDPWGLVAALGRWYLIAYDHSAADERMFRLDRIKVAEVLESPAPVPDDFDPNDYKAAFRGDAGQERVSMDISPRAWRWFEEAYPVASAREQPDGWTAVELVSGGRRWAETLVLRLGRDVRKVTPEPVIEGARSLASAIAARHAPRPG